MRSKLLVFLLLAVVEYVHASDKVNILPEPSWIYKSSSDINRQLSPKNVSDGYYLEMADHQVNLVNNTEYRHFIRHIVNESGVQNAAEISVTFSPAFQQVAFHYIIVTRDGKIVSKLNPGQIKVVQEETDASDFQYNGLKRAFVTLKDVRKGDRIEAAYSVSGFNPVFDNKYSDDIYFTSNTYVGNYFYTIIAPATRKFSLQPFNNASQPSASEQNGLTIYHWNNPELKMTESQPGVPSWFNNYPYVSISEYSNWQDVVNWGLKIFNHYQYTLSPEMKHKIEQWKNESKGDKDEYAKFAIRFVQDQVRYLGLEMGTYTHQPHTPSEVFQHRFGDCKDKALLLASLLQANDIDAYVALVNSSTGQRLVSAIPSAGNFDHAIVAIKRSMEYSFIDPTISLQRGELVNLYVPAYGYALVIKEGENKLQQITPGFLYTSTIDETLDVSSKDSNYLNVSTVYSGGLADEARKSYAETSTKELEENCVQYYAKSYNGIQLNDTIALIDDSIKNNVTVKESYIFPTLWKTDEKGKETVEVFAKPIYDDVPDPATVYKNAPIDISFPLDKYYTLKVIMPDNWSFKYDAIHIKNDSYQFDFVPAVSGKIVTLSYHFKTFKDNIPVDAINQYKTDYKQINDVLDFELYSSMTVTDNPFENSNRQYPANNINWNTVMISLVNILAMIFLFRNINRRSAYVQNPPEPGLQLGGWVIVLGITIGLGVILQFVNFVKDSYYKETIWKTLGEAGGQPLQYVLIIEMIVNLTWLCGAIALLVWFLKRRDIFPVTFIWYVGILFAGEIILIIAYSAVKYPANYGNLQTSALTRLFKTCVYAAIWVTYVIRSQRVKNTFLQPYS
jgi:hypothetical protein